jgi:hypothetical protein
MPVEGLDDDWKKAVARILRATSPKPAAPSQAADASPAR